ncbi:hypothetical protein B5E58_07160 [Tyzzerella sp. An114]|nr:hypothetical protein B5E58_07160 [Tyzzerella sp. An114]
MIFLDYIEYFFDIFEKFYNWFDFDYDIELFSLYSDDIKKNSQIYKKFDENNNGYVYQNTESFLNNFFNVSEFNKNIYENIYFKDNKYFDDFYNIVKNYSENFYYEYLKSKNDFVFNDFYYMEHFDSFFNSYIYNDDLKIFDFKNIYKRYNRVYDNNIYEQYKNENTYNNYENVENIYENKNVCENIDCDYIFDALEERLLREYNCSGKGF